MQKILLYYELMKPMCKAVVLIQVYHACLVNMEPLPDLCIFTTLSLAPYNTQNTWVILFLVMKYTFPPKYYLFPS